MQLPVIFGIIGVQGRLYAEKTSIFLWNRLVFLLQLRDWLHHFY